MKKSFLICLVCLFVFVCMTLTACDTNHEHTYESTWSFDKDYHWRAATCEHTEEVAFKEAHLFKTSGFCAYCNYKKGEVVPDPEENPNEGDGQQQQQQPQEADDESKLIYEKTDDGTYRIIGIKDSAIEAGITSLRLPQKHNKLDVTEVGSQAFLAVRTTLTSIEIPEGYTTFEVEAFSSLTYLEELIFPSTAHTYGDSLFYDCTNLKTVVFGPEAEYFSQSYAFSMCDNLETVVLPNNITAIGAYTFASCFKLNNLIIPETVTSFGMYSFYDTRSLDSIIFNGTREQWNAIQKDSTWNQGMPQCTVIFLGDIPAEELE